MASKFLSIRVEKNLRLVFDPSALRLQPGSVSRVRVTLTGDFPLELGEQVRFSPVWSDPVEGVSFTPETLLLSARGSTQGDIEVVVAEDAPVQQTTLLSTLGGISGLKNATVELNDLPVEVVHQGRAFELSFVLQRPLELLTGRTGQAYFVLRPVDGALLQPDEHMVVDLMVEGEGVSVSPTRLVFGADIPDQGAIVEYGGNQYALLKVTSEPGALPPGVLSAVSTVVATFAVDSSTLTDAVRVSVGAPLSIRTVRPVFRSEYALIFDPLELTVELEGSEMTASAMIDLILSGTLFAQFGAIPEHPVLHNVGLPIGMEELEVSITVEGEAVTVAEPAIRFDARHRQPVELQIDVSRLAEDVSVFTSTLTAIAPLGQFPSGVNATVFEQVLSVKVIRGSSTLTKRALRGSAEPELREFTLVFTTTGGRALEQVRVLAGGSTRVAVVLENADSLGQDEVVRVSFSTEVVTVRESVLELTAVKSSATFTIEAPYNASSTLGMVIASGEVVSVGSGSVVEKTRVAPTSLFDQRHRNFVESQTGEQAGQSPVATVSDQALPVELLSSAQARSRSGRSLVRRFALTFELDKLVVVEGTTISVPLRLMGIEDPIQGEPRLGDTERPLVEFSHDGKGIEPSIGLVFTDRLRQVDVVLEVAPEASSGDLLAFVSGLANATVEMALLPVNVVRTVSSSGREIALGFETVTGGSLSQLWLLTNVSTQVRLVLRNSYRLEVGENVVVTLQAPAGVAVDPGTLELSPGILHGAFTVGAAQATTVVAPIVALARWMREGVGTQSVSVSLPVSIVEFEAPEMVYVPGDEDGLSAREVSGDGFFVSRHEITRGQYAAFVAETGYAAGTCWADAVFSQTLGPPGGLRKLV